MQKLISIFVCLLLLGCGRNNHIINVDAANIDTIKVYQIGNKGTKPVMKITDKAQIKRIVTAVNGSDEQLIKFEGNYNFHFTTGDKDTISVIVFGRFIKANGLGYKANEDIEKLMK